MRKIAAALAALALCLLAQGASAQTEAAASLCKPTGGSDRKVALVIGNSAYSTGLLTSPAKDAREMQALLCGFGFTTRQAWIDVSSQEMDKLVENLSEAAQNADQVVVYYSGHGAEAHGEIRFLGVEWTGGQKEIDTTAIAISRIKAALAESPAKAKIVIIDACRNKVQLEKATTDTYQGAVPYPFAADSRILLAYATQPGYTSNSEGPGGLSLFTSALVKRMREPNWAWYRLFYQVAEDISPTGAQQRPITIGSIDDRIGPGLLTDQIRANPGDVERPAPATASVAPGLQLATDSRSLYVYWRVPESSPAPKDLADRQFLEALQLARSNPGLSATDSIARLRAAVGLLRKSSAAGHVEAATNLGYQVATGKGVPPDREAAREIWLAVADSSAAAANNLGVLTRGHDDRSANVQCAAPVAPSAWLASDVAAVDWFQKAHNMGLSTASTDLAYMKFLGRGLARDCGGARALLEQAAALGDPSAVAWLAVAFERGWGGPKDKARTETLITRAIELGDPGAMVWRAGRYKRDGESITYEQSVELLERAVTTGSPEAELSYATWIERHDARRIDRAIALYRQAAQGGMTEAGGRLAQLERILGR